MYIIQLKQTLRSIYFEVLAWRTMLILGNKGFHEFVLTILPRSLCNTLMDLLYSAFVSKLFISKDSLILHSCMLGNFASVFGCSQLNRSWQSLECSVAPDASHFPALLSSWCSIDKWACIFLFLQCITPHSHNLICKHQGNCLVIVYFCYRLMYFSVFQLM